MTKYTMDQALTLSIPEAAKVLGISRYSAYAAASRGDIPVLQIGKVFSGFQKYLYQPVGVA